jgi:hypothetical protein
MKTTVARYRYKKSAQNFIDRQCEMQRQVYGEDIRACYTIQPTVIKNSWWVAGETTLMYYVYYREAVTS